MPQDKLMDMRKKARESIIRRSSTANSGCWEYKLKIRPNGYARITFMSKSWYAHRLSYFGFNGEIPEGLDVCHKCDNRKCVNPYHLFIGTRQENMDDCVKKNRQARGEALPQTKITQDNKKQIVKMAKSGVPYIEIANQFNITPQSVGKIAIAAGVRRR